MAVDNRPSENLAITEVLFEAKRANVTTQADIDRMEAFLDVERANLAANKETTNLFQQSRDEREKAIQLAQAREPAAQQQEPLPSAAPPTTQVDGRATSGIGFPDVGRGGGPQPKEKEGIPESLQGLGAIGPGGPQPRAGERLEQSTQENIRKGILLRPSQAFEGANVGDPVVTSSTSSTTSRIVPDLERIESDTGAVELAISSAQRLDNPRGAPNLTQVLGRIMNTYQSKPELGKQIIQDATTRHKTREAIFVAGKETQVLAAMKAFTEFDRVKAEQYVDALHTGDQEALAEVTAGLKTVGQKMTQSQILTAATNEKIARGNLKEDNARRRRIAESTGLTPVEIDTGSAGLSGRPIVDREGNIIPPRQALTDSMAATIWDPKTGFPTDESGANWALAQEQAHNKGFALFRGKSGAELTFMQKMGWGSPGSLNVLIPTADLNRMYQMAQDGVEAGVPTNAQADALTFLENLGAVKFVGDPTQIDTAGTLDPGDLPPNSIFSTDEVDLRNVNARAAQLSRLRYQHALEDGTLVPIPLEQQRGPFLGSFQPQLAEDPESSAGIQQEANALQKAIQAGVESLPTGPEVIEAFKRGKERLKTRKSPIGPERDILGIKEAKRSAKARLKQGLVEAQKERARRVEANKEFNKSLQSGAERLREFLTPDIGITDNPEDLVSQRRPRQ